jgi:outer membrane protein OmpA-like peptidoglycan-associated protein
MIFKVVIEQRLDANGDKKPFKDFYINGGSADGLTESSILDVYRENIVRDAATGKAFVVSIPVGQMKVQRLFPQVAVARITGLTTVEKTPVLRYQTVMIGDYAVPGNALKDVLQEHTTSGTGKMKPADRSDLLPARVFFAYNDWKLKPEARRILAAVRDIFHERRDVDIRLEGYTCSLGTSRFNRDLSEKRVQSVATYLTDAQGIPADRIRTEYFGEAFPATSNATEEGRSLNRRVIIRFVPHRTENAGR